MINSMQYICRMNLKKNKIFEFLSLIVSQHNNHESLFGLSNNSCLQEKYAEKHKSLFFLYYFN